MKKTLTTITLAAILTLGSTFAKAGIIVAGRTADDCSTTTSKDGIIVAGLVGIIVAGLTTTGIIVAGKDATLCTEPSTERDGIIVAG